MWGQQKSKHKMDIEILIDHIKGARIKGFRDDFIKKGLLDKGCPEDVIENAFSNSGKPKRAELRSRIGKSDNSKTAITILLDDWLKYALEKEAEKKGVTLYNEVKDVLVKNTPTEGISRKVKRKTRIRKKMTVEEKDMHNIASRKYKARVKKERKKVGKVNKKEERKAKRKGLFGDWAEEVKRNE